MEVSIKRFVYVSRRGRLLGGTFMEKVAGEGVVYKVLIKRRRRSKDIISKVFNHMFLLNGAY